MTERSVAAASSPLGAALVVCASIVVILAGMHAAASVVAPVLFAFVLATLIAPLLSALRRRGLPTWLSLLVLALLVLGAGFTLIVILYGSATQLSARLPFYQLRLVDQLSVMNAWLTAKGIVLTDFLPDETRIGQTLVRLAVGLIAAFIQALSGALFVLLIMLFMLTGAPAVAGRLRRRPQGDMTLLDEFARFSASVQSNVRGLAFSNFLTGIAFALWLMLFQVDFAVLWGVLALLLGFIPKIGLFLAAAPAVALAFIQHGVATAVIVALGLTVLNIFFDNLTTKIVGDQVNLSAMTVFLAFVVWTGVLGLLGSLLAVPLTILLRLVLEHFEETRWLGALMSATETEEMPAGTARGPDERETAA
jgi:predicted PurR-regulated permease PerM